MATKFNKPSDVDVLVERVTLLEHKLADVNARITVMGKSVASHNVVTDDFLNDLRERLGRLEAKP